jgi:hypothetical protein
VNKAVSELFLKTADMLKKRVRGFKGKKKSPMLKAASPKVI